MRQTAKVLAAVLLLARGGAAALPREVPDFEATAVTAERASKAGLASLRGGPWLASFIYSRCQSSCPMIASGLQRLQTLVDPRVKIVSFSVEPEHDTPRRLRRFARKLGADPRRWMFLRMPSKDLVSLMRDGFGLTASPQPGMEVAHSGKIILVDAEGVIRGTYEGWDLNSQLQLKSEAERLLSGP